MGNEGTKGCVGDFGMKGEQGITGNEGPPGLNGRDASLMVGSFIRVSLFSS